MKKWMRSVFYAPFATCLMQIVCNLLIFKFNLEIFQNHRSDLRIWTSICSMHQLMWCKPSRIVLYKHFKVFSFIIQLSKRRIYNLLNALQLVMLTLVHRLVIHLRKLAQKMIMTMTVSQQNSLSKFWLDQSIDRIFLIYKFFLSV